MSDLGPGLEVATGQVDDILDANVGYSAIVLPVVGGGDESVVVDDAGAVVLGGRPDSVGIGSPVGPPLFQERAK